MGRQFDIRASTRIFDNCAAGDNLLVVENNVQYVQTKKKVVQNNLEAIYSGNSTGFAFTEILPEPILLQISICELIMTHQQEWLSY